MTGRYEVLDVLGSGGMATVWRARDTELDRIVAIKRPHPAPDGSAVHERFKREARAAARVSHPNVVTVHDVGTDEDGPYLVMELVDAGSLTDIEWTRERAISVGIDIAEALGALHGAGIVHRDVKPANILVPEGGAMLTDFGIARSGDDTALTQEGLTFATPAYAAPEVIAHGDHSPASDVYSLGAVLREMVLGRRVVPTTDTRVLVTDDLWAPVLDEAMSPDPVQRPAAAAFAERLRALPAAATLPATTSMPLGATAASGPVSNRSAADASTTARPIAADRDRRWIPAVAIALTAMVVVAGLVIALGRSIGGDDVTDESAPGTTTAGAASPVVTEAPASTNAEPAVTAPPETAPATSPPVTAPPDPAPSVPDDAPTEVSAARDDLASFVAGLSDDVLKRREAEKLIEDVDAAIGAAEDGDGDRAAREVESALDRIDKRIDDAATANAATDLVRRVAERIRVAVEPG